MGKFKERLLVSACLLGLNTKYNGKNNLNLAVVRHLEAVVLVPVCPEQLGGLSTPRPAAEIRGGDGHGVLDGLAAVMTKEGEDRTAAFVRGAEETLRLAQTLGIKTALLKARSPSCGCKEIYDGSFSGGKKAGDGVCTALLLRSGFQVFTEETPGPCKFWSKNGDS